MSRRKYGGASGSPRSASVGYGSPLLPEAGSPRCKPRGRQSAGAVMLEFLISFPLILTLMFGAIQLAHVWMARVVVHYAAYCAARSMLVCKPTEYQSAAERAARHICAWIHVGTESGEFTLPGWGAIRGSGGYDTATRVTTATDDPEWNVHAEVQHDFGLMVPIVGPILAALQPNPSLELIETAQWDYPYPTITLTETVYLSKPYRCTMETKWPAP